MTAAPLREPLHPLDAWQALGQLVREQRAALVRVAVREGLRPEEALECVQDALCTWIAQERGPNEGAWVATLKHMVRNAARNGRRRHHRLRPHVPIDDELALADTTRGAESLLEAAETSLRLKVCVAQLREVERAVVTLRLLEEHSGEDVARMLELSRSHVDVLVHRAKATLRVCMGADSCES
ncbi:MAG TPA: sigma-70 family RNA polymerase sigma factor [Polyangiales bacterium]|nr:sigma-70 family RNA polymerase sigma factor [Polyangiales bacterium]